MKNCFSIAALLLAACCLSVVSCKEDEAAPTPAELLTAGTCWKMTLLEGFEPNSNLWVAVPIEDCAADDCFTFKADQTLVTDEGASKCNPDDPQTAEGSWSLSADGKKLSLTDDFETQTGDIVEINAAKMVFETNLNGEKIRITLLAN